jgi:hypothetical protein
MLCAPVFINLKIASYMELAPLGAKVQFLEIALSEQ